ncbi:MATE family efflux transporter [Liquorilactobacillus satsumensis]|uniref:Na+ driven multidrug efflux pump n=1 Tax=Liquorilactobacillus satsumensis DSM 16230 = JCM 12392 TaxID=1423801 RepID=A0A0R1V1J1_9LACO|nr:MATE family efflux transporter [Liquorilactobacillus satsumensis]KRL97032.1 Na+ driven multidrug efflux pump [Liquorilactobacillus satsumensis DSM 16230 = JCM 12392]
MQNLGREFYSYVRKNILASLGLSLYVIADTIFISLAAGPLGLAALNIVLPIFNLFNSMGLLLGIGGATIFSINNSLSQKTNTALYGQLLTLGFFLGIFFASMANLLTEPLLTLLGANQQTIGLASAYLRIVSLGAAFFILNYISVNFIRNDGNPRLTMLATLTETFFVLVIDYLFIFIFKWGMVGAAWATLFAPLASLVVLTQHRHFTGRKLQLRLQLPRFKNVLAVTRLGLPSFLTEMSTGVSIFVYNVVLLKSGGNLAIAAYGVVANLALIVLALFNGISFGMQPLLAREYGKNNWKNVRYILKLGLCTSLLIAFLSFGILLLFKYPIIGIFSRGTQTLMVHYAAVGIPLYFLSIFFSGININIMMFLISINQPRFSFFMSLMRGYVILLPSIVILGHFWQMEGIWLSVTVTEFIITIFGLFFTRNIFRQSFT